MIPLARPFVGEEEKRAVLEVLESGVLVQGPRTEALEAAFARVVGTRHAVATSNGTAALHLALLAAGVGPGDEVIVTPFTFIAPVHAILMVGATPVFADIDPHTFNLDPAAAERARTPRTKAVLAVHLYGRPSDFGAWCKERDLRLIEDCAQAIGAPVGRSGLAAFSLYATKNVMSAEGGMLTTDDDDVAARWRSLRQHGMSERHHHHEVGFNYRMSDLHAAIGLVQLGRLEAVTRARREHAAYYDAHLTGVGTPEPAPGHVYHQYVVRVQGREAFRQRLANAGIETGVFYPVPAHRQPHLARYATALPEAERAAREVVSLPVHPQLTAAERATIVEVVGAQR